jgi:predicted RND superfamily exporter protein
VFGTGLFAAEFSNVIGDSLLLVVPAAVLFIVFFLVIAYRDLLDLLLGIVALALTIIWTFGFMGLAGIAFSQFLIAVPPLLLAVGIDFGIHVTKKYYNSSQNYESLKETMRELSRGLLGGSLTTGVGFLSLLFANLSGMHALGIFLFTGIISAYIGATVLLPTIIVLKGDLK